MTQNQADILIAMAQYSHEDALNLVAYQAATWHLLIGLFVGLMILITVIGILNRPRRD
jgi:uncharacterized membrane protein